MSIRTVDAYLAQGRKAAADSVPPKRDMTLDEMKAIEDEVANPRRRKNTALGYIDRDQFRRMNFGGGGFDPPTEWLDRQKVTTRLESDLVRLVSPPGTPVIRRWAEPAQVAALLEEGWTRA